MKSTKAQIYPRYIIGGNKPTYEDGIKEGKRQILSRSMDEKTLVDWYISSVDETVPPIWTEEHIAELCKDFYVIPKKNNEH